MDVSEDLRGAVADRRCVEDYREDYREGRARPGEYATAKWGVRDWSDLTAGRIEKL